MTQPRGRRVVRTEPCWSPWPALHRECERRLVAYERRRAHKRFMFRLEERAWPIDGITSANAIGRAIRLWGKR